MTSVNLNINTMTEDEIKMLYCKYKIEVNKKIVSIQNKSLEKYYDLLENKNDFSSIKILDNHTPQKKEVKGKECLSSRLLLSVIRELVRLLF